MAKVIVDAGPLVAYFKRDEEDHEWVRQVFDELTDPLITCDAALSEAFFLLQHTDNRGEELVKLLERGLVLPAFDLAAEVLEIGRLLRKYATLPMSLADACLVRMAELEKDAVVFTLDSDFRIYRKNRRQSIPLIAQIDDTFWTARALNQLRQRHALLQKFLRILVAFRFCVNAQDRFRS
jgi:uncharacterized protein